MKHPAIFLSASVPRPDRDEKYWKTARPYEIRLAVTALVTAALGRRILVWGGHPSITPLVKAAANRLGVEYDGWVRLFQSRMFDGRYPTDNRRFENNIDYVDPVLRRGERRNGEKYDREASLLKMRRRMIKNEEFDYQAGFFIGGMEGVENEFEMFRSFHPKRPVYPIPNTGGAAKILYRGLAVKPELGGDYLTLFHACLGIKTTEKRAVHPVRGARHARRMNK